ncbi:MAG TPA: hypothetical protein VMP01_16260 [Pirellulaceae bacterium]|nr:hypothetical protein [Pirellulaceae bacterium]
MALDPPTAAPPDDEPILATIVPPAPSPWQFGIRSLLGLMAVCGVQFALMRYLTVFGGLVAAVGLCFLALAVLLLWAVLFVRSRSPLMDRLDYVGIRLVVGITVLLVGTILAGGGTAVAYTVGSLWTAMELEKDFGIRTVRSEVWDEKRTYRALKIVFVYPGSDAAKANIRSGEVIVIMDGTVDQFYENMQQKRGQQIGINVAAAPVGGSIEKNPPRSITITVPK